MHSTDANTGEWDPGLCAPTPLVAGQTVRIGAGLLEGFEGVVIEHRNADRYLIQIFDGVYVETDSLQVVGS
jgi:hypothetical protein